MLAEGIGLYPVRAIVCLSHGNRQHQPLRFCVTTLGTVGSHTATVQIGCLEVTTLKKCGKDRDLPKNATQLIFSIAATSCYSYENCKADEGAREWPYVVGEEMVTLQLGTVVTFTGSPAEGRKGNWLLQMSRGSGSTAPDRSPACPGAVAMTGPCVCMPTPGCGCYGPPWPSAACHDDSINVTPWRNIDRSHGGKFHDHGHFVYKPLKHVQNFETKKRLAPLARRFRVGLTVREELIYFWVETAQQISLQFFRHGTDRYSAMV
jgi:hypothetical protein